jgi:Neocarzinostatin family
MGGVARRLLPLAAAVVLMVVMGAAPAWAAPTVTADPSTDLVSGQTIQVSGSGYSANSSIAVLQCAAGANDVFANCHIGGFVSVTTDANGSFSTSFTVSRSLPLSGRTVNCAASPGACIIAVSPFASTYLASTPLSFDPNAPFLTITVTDVTAVVRDNSVLLQGVVHCTIPSQVFINGRLRQVVRRFFIDGFFQTSVACDDEQPFSVVFEGDNGVIKQGDAELDLSAFGSAGSEFDEFTLDTTIRVRSK